MIQSRHIYIILRDYKYFSNRAKLALMDRFLIDHIDPLGQGVFKKDGEVFFIPKTLPDEEGIFKILKQKKGVCFGQLEKLTKKSPDRITPECRHFNTCSGCHFLHTDYSNELKIKTQTFARMLRDIPHLDIKVLASDQRLHYRNRIQLHYDKNLIGFKQSKTNHIIAVPDCLIMQPQLKQVFDDFLSQWQQQRRRLKEPTRGHVELYFKNNEIKINWNKPYASGGFTQVNEPLNKKVQDLILAQYGEIEGGLLELFGGEGNLSHKLNFDRRVCVDLYTDPNDDQVNLDLFKEDALKIFKKKVPDDFGCVFIDPPRSGFKGLSKWIEHYRPKNLLYMSCNPITQINDIKPILESYEVSDIWLIDFFPSTFHFESIIVMQQKS